MHACTSRHNTHTPYAVLTMHVEFLVLAATVLTVGLIWYVWRTLSGDHDDSLNDDWTPPPDPLDRGEPATQHAGRVEAWGEWRQDAESVEIFVKIADGTAARDIKAVISANKVVVGVRPGNTDANGSEHSPLLAGKLFGTIVVDESTWTIDRDAPCGQCVCLSLSKRTTTEQKREWWRAALQGGTEINTAQLAVGEARVGGGGPNISAVDSNDPESIKRIVQQLKQSKKQD